MSVECLSSYAWIIDADHLSPPIAHSEKDVTGPRNYPSALMVQLKVENAGQRFQLLDDDGELYYTGRIIGEYTGFEPLDDFGMPNAGCTEIRLWDATAHRYVSL